MINHDSEKYKSVTDLEELISRRVDQKFQKFSENIIVEHNKTRSVVEKAIKVMNETKHNKVHISILYVLSLLNLLFLILLAGVI